MVPMVLSLFEDLASKWSFAYASPESAEHLNRLQQQLNKKNDLLFTS